MEDKNRPRIWYTIFYFIIFQFILLLRAIFYGKYRPNGEKTDQIRTHMKKGLLTDLGLGKQTHLGTLHLFLIRLKSSFFLTCGAREISNQFKKGFC